MPDETRDLLPAAHAPEEDILWGRIARAVAGEPGAEPRMALAGEARTLREAERAWAAAGAARQWQGAASPDAASAYAAVWRRIQKQEQIPLRVVREERITPLSVVAVEREQAERARRQRLVMVGGLAAAAAVAIAVVRPRVTRTPEATVATTVPLGQTAGAPATIWLADSTRVVLAAHSTLTTASGYGTAHRTVSLTGEAHVVVAHRATGAPFRLQVGDAVIEDVGTGFVARRTDDGAVQVAVTDGAVKVWSARSARDTVELKVRGAVRVDTTGALRPLPDVEPTEAVAWTQERFMVRNATLVHVAEAVRSRYGVTLSYDDPALGARKVTADFGTDGAGAVAATIAATLGLDLERLGDGYRLRDPSRPRPSRSAAGN